MICRLQLCLLFCSHLRVSSNTNLPPPGSAPPAPTVRMIDCYNPNVLQDVAKQFSLNFKQTCAFALVGNCFLAELKAEKPARDGTQGSKPSQQCAYIGGAGGTGKSHVISALQYLFQMFGKAEWLITASICGHAA